MYKKNFKVKPLTIGTLSLTFGYSSNPPVQTSSLLAPLASLLEVNLTNKILKRKNNKFTTNNLQKKLIISANINYFRLTKIWF